MMLLLFLAILCSFGFTIYLLCLYRNNNIIDFNVLTYILVNILYFINTYTNILHLNGALFFLITILLIIFNIYVIFLSLNRYKKIQIKFYKSVCLIGSFCFFVRDIPVLLVCLYNIFIC